MHLCSTFNFFLFLLKPIISPVENDVVIEDIFERSSTAQSSCVTGENTDEEDAASEGSTSENSGHVVKHKVSQDERNLEADLDPKIRKGLERIRKLDAILADKQKVNCLLNKK